MRRVDVSLTDRPVGPKYGWGPLAFYLSNTFISHLDESRNIFNTSYNCPIVPHLMLSKALISAKWCRAVRTLAHSFFTPVTSTQPFQRSDMESRRHGCYSMHSSASNAGESPVSKRLSACLTPQRLYPNGKHRWKETPNRNKLSMRPESFHRAVESERCSSTFFPC